MKCIKLFEVQNEWDDQMYRQKIGLIARKCACRSTEQIPRTPLALYHFTSHLYLYMHIYVQYFIEISTWCSSHDYCCENNWFLSVVWVNYDRIMLIIVCTESSDKRITKYKVASENGQKWNELKRIDIKWMPFGILPISLSQCFEVNE